MTRRQGRTATALLPGGPWCLLRTNRQFCRRPSHEQRASFKGAEATPGRGSRRPRWFIAGWGLGHAGSWQDGLNLTSGLEQMSGSTWTLKSTPGKSGTNSLLAKDGGVKLPIDICYLLKPLSTPALDFLSTMVLTSSRVCLP